ncbi:related to Protein CGI121 [Saccharomycodes ludwigii]|uniref:EKC/KEOPS complex subunit CGI121 n=1 Tax=Saccharomycodes ludwigii TaxID=36035 RepID=A0A376B3H9_9ASCO|nr:hypothetical protein SCDLUD_004919 [Saccharomycodes ludwigii]KAH3899475.1 hypothetical protein SCDLUD_004919 [Saccharomycodes ludwigii]SSD59245.1 related to Protein CGI121 [Saccharomycodes ludwigii]
MLLVLPQFPDYSISINLFTNCNYKGTTQALTSCSVEQAPRAFIKASNIYSTSHLLCAIYKSFIEYKYNRLRTKNLSTEVILSLYSSSNISEAFKQFGVNSDSVDTDNIIVLQIFNNKKSESYDANTNAYGIDNTLLFEILGKNSENLEFNDANLIKIRDISMIKKIYKIKHENSTNNDQIERCIINSIQLRGL